MQWSPSNSKRGEYYVRQLPRSVPSINMDGWGGTVKSWKTPSTAKDRLKLVRRVGALQVSNAPYVAENEMSGYTRHRGRTSRYIHVSALV